MCINRYFRIDELDASKIKASRRSQDVPTGHQCWKIKPTKLQDYNLVQAFLGISPLGGCGGPEKDQGFEGLLSDRLLLRGFLGSRLLLGSLCLLWLSGSLLHWCLGLLWFGHLLGTFGLLGFSRLLWGLHLLWLSRFLRCLGLLGFCCLLCCWLLGLLHLGFVDLVGCLHLLQLAVSNSFLQELADEWSQLVHITLVVGSDVLFDSWQ